MKILLLEDDLELCSLIQSQLTKNGYMVDACNDGEAAMLYALHTDYSYDLAIVDRMLPVIDGLTIIKAMRKKDIQIPVIIITGMTALNEKIEGFYQICKMRGFNGMQGVIIPAQNVRNLHLSDEIIDSVRKSKFHIYAVRTIDEGIEILTGVPAGAKDKNGKFPLGTINFLVSEKLKKFSKQASKEN